MVVSDQPLATATGLAVLQDGGNAVDAAVATAFALAVVLPSAGNIGGGGFIVAHLDGQGYALDFRETAPGSGKPRHVPRCAGRDRGAIGHGTSRGGRAGECRGTLGGPSEARVKTMGEPRRAGDSPRGGRLRGGRVRRDRHQGRGRSTGPLSRVSRAVRAGGAPAHARHAPQEPRSRAHAAPHRRARARRVLQGRDRGSARGGNEAGEGDHHRARPGGLRGEMAHADRVPVPRARGDLHAAALFGRPDARADCRTALRVRSRQPRVAHREGCASDGRGHAARVRRAQRGARRSRFRHLRSARAPVTRSSAPRCAHRSRPTAPRRRARCRAGPRLRRAGRPRTSP